MADVYQSEISKLLHRHHIFLRHEKPRPILKGRTVIGWSSDDRATPDLVGGLSHQIWVEVKTGKSNRFDFSEWRVEQRSWAAEWREKRKCEYWIALVIETPHSPHRVKRVAFLVPYPRVIEVEELLSPIQASINYLAVKGTRKILQEQQWDAHHLWAEFELDWLANVGWELPAAHPFRQMYINAPGYLYEDVFTQIVI